MRGKASPSPTPSNNTVRFPSSSPHAQQAPLLPSPAVHRQLPAWPSLLHLGYSPCGREGVNTRALIYSCAWGSNEREGGEGWMEREGPEKSCGGPDTGGRNISIISTAFQLRVLQLESPGWKVCVWLGMRVCNLNYVSAHLAVLILELPARKKNVVSITVSLRDLYRGWDHSNENTDE